jgi:hypothetical protein
MRRKKIMRMHIWQNSSMTKSAILMKKMKRGPIKYFCKRLESKIKHVCLSLDLEIRKILRGEFKGNNQKRDMTAELLGNQNNEAARLARMEECMKILRERDNDVDDNNDDEDEI